MAEYTVDLTEHDLEPGLEFEEHLEHLDEELTRPFGANLHISERVDVVADVQISLPAHISLGETSFVAKTRDVSETGLFLLCGEDIRLGQTLVLGLLFPGHDDWSLVEHEVHGIVVREEEGVGYGVQLIQTQDEFLRDIRSLALIHQARM